jgi:hypothetical protein
MIESIKLKTIYMMTTMKMMKKKEVTVIKEKIEEVSEFIINRKSRAWREIFFRGRASFRKREKKKWSYGRRSKRKEACKKER